MKRIFVTGKRATDICRGKYISKIEGLEEFSELVKIVFKDGSFLEFSHPQDCSEEVSVDQIDRDPRKVEGSTFLELKVKTESKKEKSMDYSSTWTFYTLITSKGFLDFRWGGHSNGHYSEEVNIYYIE